MKLNIKFDEGIKTDIRFLDTTEKFGFSFDASVIKEKIKEYEGPYTVTPLALIQQVLNTEGKRMLSDVIVEGIPYDISNDTVAADKLYKGITAHDSAGNSIVGTAEITVVGKMLVMPTGFISVPVEV